MSFTLRCHPALVVRKHNIIILRYQASLFFRPIQFLKSTCGFRNIKCFTGKGYWPFAQPPTWRARCCSLSDLSPGTCPARLNLPGTAVPADIASFHCHTIIKTIQQIKSRIKEIKEDEYTNSLAKILVGAMFRAGDI